MNACEEAARLDPRAFQARYCISAMQMERGELAKALSSANLALQYAQTPVEVGRGTLHVAAVLRSQGRRNEAEKLCLKAVATFRRELTNSPANAELKLFLGRALSETGRLYIELSRLNDASIFFDENLSIQRSIYNLDPTNIIAKTNLANALQDLGYLKMKRQSPVQALVLYKESLAASRAALDANPSVANRINYSIAITRVGDAAEELKDWHTAETSYLEALQIDRAIAALDQSNDSYQESLEITLNKVGRVAKSIGNFVKAISAMRESISIGESLVSRDPSNASKLRRLLIGYANLAQIAGQEQYWNRAFYLANSMNSRGILAPEDQWMLEETRRRAIR